MEEMGRAVMPGPFLSTVLLGGAAIGEAGSPAQHREWLPRISAGNAKAALARTEANLRRDAAGIGLPARDSTDGFNLTGTKLFVGDAPLADILVVTATRDGSTMEDGVSLFLVPKDTPSLAVTVLPTIGETRKLCEVSFGNVALPGIRIAWRDTPGLGTIVARRCTRHIGIGRRDVRRCPAGPRYDGRLRQGPHRLWQADRQLSGGQAPGRRYAGGDRECQVADLLPRLGGRSGCRQGAARGVEGQGCCLISDMVRKVADTGIQLHGGIGMTWEHDLQLYFKRAKASEVAFGDATWHRECVAQLVAA
jgi:alkylation response protein AidB-like acyl-CoA dehydrogenase